MLIDVHAHFYTELSGRSDWREMNQARLEAGATIGIDAHVASILGTYGTSSPTYFPSPEDVTHANDRMVQLQREHPGRVYGYCVVNPNYAEHALQEIERRVEEGMVGVKLAASRRATDRLLDPIAQIAAERRLPILHHIWQHRRREWPGQDASDAVELVVLARRHPETRFLLAHIGGGGDWLHSLRAVRRCTNVWVDLSGSGVDAGMLEATLAAVGASRMVWGTDLSMGAGWGKLRYLRALGMSADDIDRISGGNAFEIFPHGAFRHGD